MVRIAASPTNSFSFPRQPLFLAALLLLAGLAVQAAEDSALITVLRQEAEAGDAEAMNSLGDAYAKGEGVDQNHAAALGFYRQAAARGHGLALYNLGQMAETGMGMRANEREAFLSYVKSAEQGFPPAQLKVGDKFASGVGTSRDDAAAVSWYRKAADNGIGEAAYNLGLAYEHGRGVAKDREQARKWYSEAVSRGFVQAGFNLALMLESGLGSVADATTVAELYRNAAEQGFAPAQNNYGLLLAEGRGDTPPNLIESYAWLTIAVENGANAAGLNLVAQKLNSEQLAAANDRVTVIREALATGSGAKARPEPAAPTTGERLAAESPVRWSPPINPVESAPSTPRDTRMQGTVVPATDPKGLAVAEAQLAAALQEISTLKAEQDRLNQSSTQLVTELGALLSSAAETVEARGLLTAAEQKVRDLARTQPTTPASMGTPDIPAPGGQESRAAALAEARRNVDSLRARSTEALARWSDHIARLSPDTKPAAKSNVDRSETPALKAELVSLATLVKDLTRENETLLSEQERLESENARLLTELGALQKLAATSVPGVPAAPEEAVEKQENLQAQVRDALTKLAEAESQLAQLRQAGETARIAASADGPEAVERAELLSRLAQLTEAHGELEREPERLTNENTKLAAEKNAAVESAAVSGQTLAASSAEERDALRKELGDLTARLAAAEQQVIEARNATAAARAETEAVQRRAEEIQAELVSAQLNGARIDELTSALETLTRENEAMQPDLQSLATLREENRRLAARETALFAAEERIRQLETETARAAAVQPVRAGVRSENARLSDRTQVPGRLTEVADVQRASPTPEPRVRAVPRAPDQRATTTRTVIAQELTPAMTAVMSRPEASRGTTAGRLGRARFHIVTDGESLTRISVRYYGTANRWREIYVANRDLLLGQSALRIGQHLRVP